VLIDTHKGNDMSTSDDKYNGWTNYETWLVNLWMDNEENTQAAVTDMARQALADNTESEINEAGEDVATTDKDQAISDLANQLEAMHDDALADIMGVIGVFKDLLQGSLGRVDWREIAESHVDVAIEEAAL
jgi:hypothetical protein